MNSDPRDLERRFAELELGFATSLVRGTRAASALGLRIESFGPAGAVVVCETSPHLMFNRALALGVEGSASDEVLDRALAALHVQGRAPNYQVSVSPCAEPADLVERLLARDLVPFRRDLMVLVRAPTPVPEAATRFRVARASPEHAAAFAEILGEAFVVPTALRSCFSALVEQPSCHVFLAFDAERPIAGSAMVVSGRSAYLVAAATRPSHRGGGAHDALVSRRLEAAHALGCNTVFVDTGTPVPGEPSPSLDNLRRAGFESVFVRKSLVAPGTTWTG